MKRLIIGISGASGAIYGVRMLQVLRDVPDIETHLILSQAARQTLAMETDYSVREVQALADVVHDARDIAASISSGSFKTAGMVILPHNKQRTTSRHLRVLYEEDDSGSLFTRGNEQHGQRVCCSAAEHSHWH